MSGRYGEPISWDMICAQARWYGIKVPREPPTGDTTQGGGSSNSATPPSPPNRLRTLFSALPVTNDNAKYHTQRVSPGCYGQ